MKQIISTVVLVAGIVISSFAQSQGLIKYSETVKLDIQVDMPDGIDLSGLLPESTTLQKELYFTDAQSIYQDAKENENLDQEINSDDGSMQIIIKTSEFDESLFLDYESHTSFQFTGFMGKSFLIEKPIKKRKWKLTGDKIMYLGYECHKAEMVIQGEAPEDENTLIVAWFAPTIKTQAGPSSYNQLPGAILMLSVDGDKTEIKATEINLDINPSEFITKPTKGKKVTQAEFEEIMIEKEKEMKEMFGEGGMIIRN